MSTHLFNTNAGNRAVGRETVLLFLTALMFFTFYLPSSPVINNIAILALVVCCSLYNSWKEKISLLRERPAILFIIAFYVMQVVSMFLSEDRDKGLLYLQVRIPLLLFPISMGLIYIRKALKVRMYFIYAVITTLAALFCLACAFLTYYRTGDSGFIYNDSLSQAIGKQSVYFALMVNLAIFSYAYLLVSDYIRVSFRKFIMAAIAFLMIIQFMLASRMEIIFLSSSVVIFTLYYFFVRKKNNKAGYLVLGALAICAVVFVQLFPKTMNRFNELRYAGFNYKSEAVESHYNMKLTPEQWNGLNIRLAIWSSALGIVKQHPLTGANLGDKDQALLDAFQEKGFNFGIRTNKNMHSTYLDILAGLGLIGLLTFMAGFVLLPLISSIRAKDVIGALVMIDFMLSFITETYPDRSMGCIIFGFFVAFILSYKEQRELAYSRQTVN